MTSKLDFSGAQAIYDRIYECDSLLAKQRQVLDNAMLDIADALVKIKEAENVRRELSAQLDRFAPEGFHETGGLVMTDTTSDVPMAGAPSPFTPRPGSLPHPYPAPFPAGHGLKPWHRDSILPKRTPRGPSLSKAPEYDDF